MSRRNSVGFVLSPKRPASSRLSVGGRRSIGGIGVLAAPASASSITNVSDSPTSAFLAIQNDDEEERRQRQLSRLQQLQHSRHLHSPSTSGTAGDAGDRRKSVSSLEPRLTGQQLAQHYATCIQLSAENKINIKNAFNLQLIDYMTEMLRRKDSDMNNFQVASCTLDASTKIYAYRVDSVHTDTMRMAGGLGRSAHPGDTGGDAAVGGGDEGEGGDGAVAKIKKRRNKKAATIESNPSNLTLSALDLEFMVDPLFKKIASQFDEGRAGGGLFLNSLMLRDDSCQLLLDSQVVLDTSAPTASTDAATASPTPDATVTIPLLPDLSKKEICPAFSSFHFTSWKVGDEDTIFDSSQADPVKKKPEDEDKEHAFDMNAVPEPLEDDNMLGYDNADYGGVEDACDMDGGDDDTVAATLGEGGNNTCLTVGWGGQHASSGLHPTPHSMETIHLKEHLASMPLEYSYFDSRVMSAWAGPGHWKLKPATRDKTSLQSATETGKKRKKEIFELTFRLNPEVKTTIDKQFEVSRRLTKLSQNTIKMWSEDNTTLPVDLHFDPSDFAKLYGRTEVVVRRNIAAAAGSGDTTLALEDDDGVPDHTGGDDHNQDGAEGGGDCDTSGGGYDMTLFSQTMMPPLPAGEVSAEDFLGDNLVVAPNRVAKINIGYARTAKRMDMKKLKSTLWDMLTTTSGSDSQDKENDRNCNVAPSVREGDGKDRMATGCTVKFSQVYRSLPRRLNQSMAENLSLPLAFIALLHLCNERHLALTCTGDMEDFTITQG